MSWRIAMLGSDAAIARRLYPEYLQQFVILTSDQPAVSPFAHRQEGVFHVVHFRLTQKHVRCHLRPVARRLWWRGDGPAEQGHGEGPRWPGFVRIQGLRK